MPNESTKWLYEQLTKRGYNVGKDQTEFDSLMATNAESRTWAFETARKSGLNVGKDMDEFTSLVAPAPSPQTPPAAPAPTQAAQTQAPAVQSTATAAPASAPVPAEEPEQAPAQSAPAEPAQPAWQPTEQEKIRMSYQMHTMLNDFNQKSKARLEQIQRLSEPFTPEGRKKRRELEFQAQLAGTPTKVMGLTPPTPAPASDGAQDNADGAAQKPVQSEQSPVPYGVRYIDGKPVTQWLLPDGRLTTNLMEADQAEYGARTVRLRHQFENRMKQNGLDPAKPEDVEMQAQYDAQAPAYDAVAELWQEAEEKHKADKERNADREWSNYAAMGGGREMRIVTTAANRHADNISHMTRFDLQKMMDNAWARAGSKVTANCYNRLRQQYPDAPEEELQATASQMAHQLTYNAVYQYAVQQNTPKSTLEYFGRTVADMNVINSISKGLARSQAGTSGDLAAYKAAMGEYGKNHRVAQIAGTVTGMAVDPVTWVSGGVGSLAGKVAINLGGRFIAGRAATSMSTQVGSRLFSSSLTGRIITGAAAGGGNFATYEMLKEGESQFLHGGHINPETGENEGYSAGAVLSAGGHGLVLGSVTGTLSPVIGNVADKTVKATTSTGVKAGVRFGEVAVSTLAEGTIFALPEWYDNSKRSDSDPNKRDNFDIWTDNMAMMLGFKAQHGLKSAPRVIASLRPVKPVNGRPLTQAERNHNRMDFEERICKALDPANINNLTGADDAGRVAEAMRFTADEREELRRAGYGELAELFSRDRVQEASQPNPAEGAIELRAERVEAETISRNPEFDGYSSMEELMQDGNVSQSARAKAYYILTGRRLPMASVTGYTTKDADGRVTVNSIAADGEVVTSRTFKNEQEAKQETDNIMRQAELNSVDVGERYKEAVADDMVLDAAISEVSPGADPATIKKIYRSVKAGNKDVTESQVQLAEFLDDAIARNKDIADKYRPEAIREELMNETGIDVDAVLRKMPSKRTEAEQEAVKSYLERLFPEEARQQTAEPTAEQAEAQSQYEQGRELFGRFEEGDPTVQADVDAIALRMQEAYQAVEDAFGSEAEYYMFHVNENPWALVDDPELTVEQRDAVLYYINSKAALDGVMDASNEAADRKRAEVEESVAKRTHKDNGVIIPATMKVDDRPVYIVKGDVAMFPDGTAVDVHNSSESVVVMDAQTGEYQFTSPDQIYQVSEAVNPQDELDTALSVIEQEQMNIFGDNAVAPEESAEGEEPQQTTEAPATADTVEYDRGYEQGLEEAAKADDAWIANHINILSQNTPESMPDTMKGELDAYLYEQQRRAQSVPEMPESVPNPTENPEIDAENSENPTGSVPKLETEPQQSALSRIPLDDKGKPNFAAAPDTDTAWDALVEKTNDEAMAQSYADNMVAAKEAALKKAEKAKTKPTEDLDEFMAAEQQRKNAITAAQNELATWQRIAGTSKRRSDAIRAQQEAEARAATQARAEQEAVDKADREEQERIEREALEGIPEWHLDTPENARKRGARRFQGQLFTRQEPLQGVAGKEIEVKFSQNDLPKGRVAVIDAAQLQPSHIQGNRNPMFFIEDAQPKNRAEQVSMMAAREIAEGIRPEEITGSATAYTGAPTVNTRGEVIQGNNRSDALRYLWENNLPEQQGKYRQYIIDNAAQFGLDPEAVANMEHPVLVNMLDVDDAEAVRLGMMTAQDTESGGVERIKPKNVAQKLGDGMRTFANMLLNSGDEDASFGQLVDRNGTEVLKWMAQTGAITGTQYRSAFDSKGNLTAEAKNDLQKVLYQAVFKGGSQQLEEMFDKLPAKAQRAILSTAFRDMDSPFTGRLLPELQASIIAYNELMTDPVFASAKKLEECLNAVEAYKRVLSLDDRFETVSPSDNFSNFAMHLAAMYKASDLSQSTLASYFNQMYDLAQGKKAATLFEEADTTEYPLAEVVNKVLGID